jgi:hypothetical protein
MVILFKTRSKHCSKIKEKPMKKKGSEESGQVLNQQKTLKQLLFWLNLQFLANLSLSRILE